MHKSKSENSLQYSKQSENESLAEKSWFLVQSGELAAFKEVQKMFRG